MNDTRKRHKRKILLSLAVIAAALAWALAAGSGLLRGQTNPPAASPTSAIFTPAHTSLGQAVRHFFGIRPTAVQPLAYTHKPHIEVAQLECAFCHEGVDKGPRATIPNIEKCMMCHSVIATEKPVIQELTAYYNRHEDVPWQRVYGWNEEAHVRFNHAPHIRAQVTCATCHGDVAQMTDAKRVVDHTMGFCVACHESRQASNDCLTCHY